MKQTETHQAGGFAEQLEHMAAAIARVEEKVVQIARLVNCTQVTPPPLLFHFHPLHNNNNNNNNNNKRAYAG
jgi:hypothetical protein